VVESEGESSVDFDYYISFIDPISGEVYRIAEVNWVDTTTPILALTECSSEGYELIVGTSKGGFESISIKGLEVGEIYAVDAKGEKKVGPFKKSGVTDGWTSYTMDLPEPENHFWRITLTGLKGNGVFFIRMGGRERATVYRPRTFTPQTPQGFPKVE
jgi:hypothetical protein